MLRHRNSRPVWALSCLALFFLLQIFAASGALHRVVHTDAASPGHHCVITLITKGHLNAPPILAALAVFVALFFFSQPVLQTATLSAADRRLSPSRAPPFA